MRLSARPAPLPYLCSARSCAGTPPGRVRTTVLPSLVYIPGVYLVMRIPGVHLVVYRELTWSGPLHGKSGSGTSPRFFFAGDFLDGLFVADFLAELFLGGLLQKFLQDCGLLQDCTYCGFWKPQP